MRTLLNTVFFSLLLIFYPAFVSGQFDDLYFTPGKDKLPAFAQKNQQMIQPVYEETGYYEQYEDEVIADEYYDDYDYSYTNRIQRFHSPARVIHHYSFNSWYDDFYYDPFFPNNNINIFIGSPFIRPWGWNSWNVGWGWNSWGPGWGWNSWNNPWGWNSWNVGWGWNSWNPGWGWNSWNNPWGWNSCPTIWNVNNFYGNNWNGWNNNNWNIGVGNNTIYASRRGGSTSSSTRGISASPRREASGWTSGQVDRIPDTPTNNNGVINSAASRGGADRSRIYKGDIRNQDADVQRGNVIDNTNVNPHTTNATRSSIYRRPDNQRTDTGITTDRTGVNNDTQNANRNSARVNKNSTDANRSNSSRQSSGNQSNQNNIRPFQDNNRDASRPRSSGGFDSGSYSPRSSGSGGINSGSSRSSGGGSMNSGGGSSRSSSGGGSRRGG